MSKLILYDNDLLGYFNLGKIINLINIKYKIIGYNKIMDEKN